MISILEEKQGEYKVIVEQQEIGFIKTYKNDFHKANCYLKLELKKYDVEFAKTLFVLLQDKVKCPLQVMIASTEREKVAFLEQGGFRCKRKCYELEVTAEQLQGVDNKLPECVEEIVKCKMGTNEYDLCARFMFEYYARMHENINPLTADYEMFATRLPEDVFYKKDTNGIFHVAFIEENEIAYVGTRNSVEFKSFIENVIRKLFEEYEKVVFECDDCDEAAMELRKLFAYDVDESYDTYIMR